MIFKNLVAYVTNFTEMLPKSTRAREKTVDKMLWMLPVSSVTSQKAKANFIACRSAGRGVPGEPPQMWISPALQ
jgi:hypothetical protein